MTATPTPDGWCPEREPIGELRPIVTGQPSGTKRSVATYPLGAVAPTVRSREFG
jgi:hypothetical protein